MDKIPFYTIIWPFLDAYFVLFYIVWFYFTLWSDQNSKIWTSDVGFDNERDLRAWLLFLHWYGNINASLCYKTFPIWQQWMLWLRNTKSEALSCAGAHISYSYHMIHGSKLHHSQKSLGRISVCSHAKQIFFVHRDDLKS